MPEQGLGVSGTVHLSSLGVDLFNTLRKAQRLGEGVLPYSGSPHWRRRALALGLFHGIAGLRRSLERLLVPVIMSVSVECPRLPRRVVLDDEDGADEDKKVRRRSASSC